MFCYQAATFLFILLATTANANDVPCVYMESCVLPCPFRSGTNPTIHWLKEPGLETRVHIYYEGQSHFLHQDPNYSGRTSLSKEDVDSGNASLLLRKVTLQDGGKYHCYVSAMDRNEENNYIDVHVYAPVLNVSLQQDGQQLLCKSENIFPKPNVTWTSPEPRDKSNNSFNLLQSGLYSVLSSVPLTQSPPLEYSCNVSNKHSWSSAIYRRNPLINSTGSEVTIPCAVNSSSSINSLSGSSVLWTFNQTQSIVNRTGSEVAYSETWRHFVNMRNSGSLHLKGLTKEHEGQFSCEVTTDRETVSVHTELKISAQQGNLTVDLIVGCTLLALVVIIIAIAVVICVRRNNGSTQRDSTESRRSAGHENGDASHELMNGGQNLSHAAAAASLNSATEEVSLQKLDRCEETDSSEEQSM